MNIQDEQQTKEYYLGRAHERSYIDGCIRATDDSCHLIYIYGQGGVGKTALLDQIVETYSHPNAPGVALADIDFDDLTLRLPTNFMERLADRLSAQGAGEMFDRFRDLLGRPDRRFAGPREPQEETREAFVDGLRRLTAQRRLLVLVDTLEKAPIWFPAFFASLVAPVQNVVIVSVGREESKRIEQPLEEALTGPDKPGFEIRAFQWMGLDSDLCEAYFSSRQEFEAFDADLTLLTVPITFDLQRRIWELAQGIPFQINLFVGMLRFLESGTFQLTQHINELLEEIQAAELEKLKDNHELRQRFQQALVAPFVLSYELPKLEDDEEDEDRLSSRIILLIAHVNHYMAHALGGFDASVLAELDDTLAEAEVRRGLKLIEDHRRTRYSFVKLFHGVDGLIGIGLHDEMARMLNELGWIQLDSPGLSESIRSEISRKLVDYYDHRCLELYAEADQKAQIDQAEGKRRQEQIGDVWKRAVAQPRGQALLLARTFHSMYRDFGGGWQWIYSLSERIFRQSYFDALLYQSVQDYVQATGVIRDADIDARMNVWEAGAIIARRDLSPGDLDRARGLLRDSISIWRDRYQADEEEVRQLEEARAELEELRRGAQERLRPHSLHAPQVQPILHSYDEQLGAIDRAIQAKTHFSDLERAYTSLGFIHRLEGRWSEAIRYYDEALRYSRWLANKASIAELTNNMANVYLLWGKLTDAALYGQIGAIIRRHLDARRELGHSYRILGMINWRIGNTYECRKYLNQARECYEHPVDIARVDLYEGYTYYRIGDTEIGHKSLAKLPTLKKGAAHGGHYIPPVRSYPLLKRAGEVFEQYEETNDLSWVHNVLSRAYRRDNEFEQAEEVAKKALDLTNDALRVGEANLSLCMLYYRWGMKKMREGDTAGALKEFEKVDQHYDAGYPLARDGQFVSLLSVYQGIKGNTEYERGAHQGPAHYQSAFRYYLEECQISAQNKMLRFERALNEVVADRLARMPIDRALECATILTDVESWRGKGLEQEYRKLRDEVDELMLFLGLPEKEEIDRMERSFYQHIRLGSYREALEEATNALQKFRRYNWTIDTVRILLKVAQAHRKVTQFTQARRHCKQALLVIDTLSRQARRKGQSIELIRQKAHTDFTMGRILWEIGNTAEAASHFRFAREAYLRHRNHRNADIAREMREGLARSVQYEGFMRFRIGEFDSALQFLDWAEQEYRTMGNERRVAKVLNLKARIYRDRDAEGDIEAAHQALEEALELGLGVGDNYTIAECYLTGMILEYQESCKAEDQAQRLAYLEGAEEWYHKGAGYAHDNGYALLQAVFEGVRGNILFDRAKLKAGAGGEPDLEPAFDQYLEECRWDAYYEERRFFRSLDLLMQRLSTLNGDQIRRYNRYIRENWVRCADEGKLPGESSGGAYSETAIEYVSHMNRFCHLVEDFSEYIATESEAIVQSRAA